MKRFKEFIAEARRNPEQNPKISAYEALLPYKDDPTTYISFTTEEKVGINPQSKFNTPLGIYCYPLKEAWGKYDIGLNKDLTGLPFAADRPFVWVLRAKPTDGFVNDMYTDYGSNNYDTDVKILQKIFKAAGPIRKEFVSYDHDADLYQAMQKVGEFEDVVAEMQPDPNDEGQVTLYNKFAAKLKMWQDEVRRLEAMQILTWDELERVALENAKVQNPVMSFWNLSRLLANRIAGTDQGISAATKWNWILRQCGYTGFADKTSRGYIHPSEPMQAVFLSRQAFTVVEKVFNVSTLHVEKIESFGRLIHLIRFNGMSVKQSLELLNGSIDHGPLLFKKEFLVDLKKLAYDVYYQSLRDWTERVLKEVHPAHFDKLRRVWAYIVDNTVTTKTTEKRVKDYHNSLLVRIEDAERETIPY